MRTYSHVLITALAGDGLKRRGISIHMKGLLLGSFLPDVPLMILTVGYVVYHRWVNPMPMTGFFSRYDYHFFNDPLWIVPHNFLHAPFILALLLVVSWPGLRRGNRWMSLLFWLAVGASFHTLVDVFTHNYDGPLLLFPFNWHYRFRGPVSYWDPRYYGRPFTLFEYGLDLVILAYFLVQWRRRRSAGDSPGKPAQSPSSM